MGSSFIQVLFLYKYIIYKSCFDPLGSDCLNNGWSISNRIAECGGYKFIGRFGERTQLTQTFFVPQESKLKFTFMLAKIDSWDTIESFSVSYDGISLDKIYSQQRGRNMCYDSEYDDYFVNMSYKFTSTLGNNNVTIKLSDNFDESINNESWGIRSVLLEVQQLCVEFFSECNYQGNRWRICAGDQTSLTREIPFKIKSIIILDGITVKMKDSKYFGNNTQIYSTHEPCLTDFNFPKYQKQT